MSEVLAPFRGDAYKSLAVVVPAYNAAETVADVVKRVRSVSPDLAVIVVDDGSSDTTARDAEVSGAIVISHTQNRGKGAALRTGFDECLRRGYRAVITLDADGQHSPDEIPTLIDCWRNKGADIVIGTRRRDANVMPVLRRFTNTISSWLVSLSSGRYIADSQSGYRLLTRAVIERVRTKSSGYEAESELLIRGASAGFTIAAAPISTIYRDEKSYIHPFKEPLLFLGLIVRSFFWRFEGVGRRQAE